MALKLARITDEPCQSTETQSHEFNISYFKNIKKTSLQGAKCISDCHQSVVLMGISDEHITSFRIKL